MKIKSGEKFPNNYKIRKYSKKNNNGLKTNNGKEKISVEIRIVNNRIKRLEIVN